LQSLSPSSKSTLRLRANLSRRTLRGSPACSALSGAGELYCSSGNKPRVGLEPAQLTRAAMAECLVRTSVVVPLDPHLLSSRSRDQVIAQTPLHLSCLDSCSIAPAWRACRCNELPMGPVSRQAARKRRLCKISPLSLRITGVEPSGRSVPKRARQASSSARSASLARPCKANS
jgi:hypothetical protein